LDRGALVKFIERAGREATPVSPAPCIRPPHHGSAPYLTLQGFEERSYSRKGLEKNRESFLNRLFDFE
jgi:Zn-finger nucleic acid-binding protein